MTKAKIFPLLFIRKTLNIPFFFGSTTFEFDFLVILEKKARLQKLRLLQHFFKENNEL